MVSNRIKMDTTAHNRLLGQGQMLNWYRVERVLGRGGFGVIYLATDTNLDLLVAIKEYRLDLGSGTGVVTEDLHAAVDQGLQRFIDEARNLVRFKHPNIVRVMSVFELNDTAYMVMEFEEGKDLRAYLEDRNQAQESALKKLFLPISEGLAEVHKHGFIHRDIKPANILVRIDGSPVLLDFGSARHSLPTRPETMTALVSAGYAPLEQYSGGDGQQGAWTDIYAMGAVLYFAVTGTEPIDSAKRGTALINGGKDPLVPARIVAAENYTVEFLNAIDWALQFRIADRPKSLSDWMPALLGASEHDSVSRKEALRETRRELRSDITRRVDSAEKSALKDTSTHNRELRRDSSQASSQLTSADPLDGLSMLDQPVPREIEAARYKRRRPNKRVLLAWIATLLVGVVAAGWAVPKWLKSGSSDLSLIHI